MTAPAPRRSRRAAGPLALSLVVGLGACSSTPEPAPGGNPPAGNGGQANPQQRPAGLADAPAAEADPRIEVNLNIDWEDIDKNDRGEKDAEEVARWVTERRNAVQSCLNNKPQALTQAVELLQEITTRVPDSSKDRFMLAQCYFVDAVYWWRMTDVTAWEMNRIKVERKDHASRGGGHMTDAQVDARIAELKPYFDGCLAQLDVSAKRALATFIAYRQARPDDKRVYDYLWKLYFFVQDFREAKRWLELVLYEMDLAEVPAREPLRQDYEALVDELKDKIIEERTGEYVPIRPIMRDRFGGGRPGER